MKSVLQLADNAVPSPFENEREGVTTTEYRRYVDESGTDTVKLRIRKRRTALQIRQMR